jgi:hypothetical protein
MKILNDIESNLNWIEGRLCSRSTHNIQGRKYLECTKEIARGAMLVSVSFVDGALASIAFGSCCTTRCCVSLKKVLWFPHFLNMLAHKFDSTTSRTCLPTSQMSFKTKENNAKWIPVILVSCELQIVAIIRKKISNNFALSTAISAPCQIKYSKD